MMSNKDGQPNNIRNYHRKTFKKSKEQSGMRRYQSENFERKVEKTEIMVQEDGQQIKINELNHQEMENKNNPPPAAIKPVEI